MVEYEYAKALFDLAQEEDKIELFLSSINAVVDTMHEQRDFLKIMNSPSIEKKDKLDIVNNVYSSLDDTFVNFIKVLVENQRFSLLPNILDEYNKLYHNYHNILNVEVISSESLSDVQMKQVYKRLETRYPGKELKIENTVNPKILGGLQIICNGESLDLSLKGQLLKLKESL